MLHKTGAVPFILSCAFVHCSLYALCVEPVSAQQSTQQGIQQGLQQSAQVVAEIGQQKISKEALTLHTRKVFGVDLEFFSSQHLHFLHKQVLEVMVNQRVLSMAAQAYESRRLAEQRSEGEAEESRTTAPETAAEELAAAREKEETREEILARYFDEVVFSSVSTNEDEVQAYYQAHKEEFLIPREVQLREIVLFFDEDDSAQARFDAIGQMEALRALLLAEPQLFAERARQLSQARSAARGGLRGFVTPSQLQDELAAVVRGLAVGELSEVISNDEGVYLLRIEKQRDPKRPEFSEIVEVVQRKLIAEKRKQRLAEHLKTLRARYNVIVYYN